MDSSRFDAIARQVFSQRTRRMTLGLMGGLLAQPLLAQRPSEAKKRKKKKPFCLDGLTIQASKKKTKKLRKRGATPGPCSPPPPRGPNAACPADPGVVSGYAWYLYVAQTFTEPNGGRLQAASLWIRNTGPNLSGTYELLVCTVDPATGVPQHGTTQAVAQP